ncbi:MAG TPA: hypothetical protein VLV86_19770 [Vicinamibacterales bacterium]|nr:hypothetical protein [Vicinamibacterales bacterium]
MTRIVIGAVLSAAALAVMSGRGDSGSNAASLGATAPSPVRGTSDTNASIVASTVTVPHHGNHQAGDN